MQQTGVLVTGAAGFIGMHLCAGLLAAGYRVVGIDNLNDYYSIELKQNRLLQLQSNQNFYFQNTDITDTEAVVTLIKVHGVEVLVNLAAQAGVRYSLINPFSYGHSNLMGMMSILEASRKSNIKHLIYASSSSVYGANRVVPFSEEHAVDHPVSLYAATKKSNELLAHSYAHMYGLPVTGLRFFTVYGPWGRPDMATWLFTEAILRETPLTVYAGGELSRDFTYIDDVVSAIIQLVPHVPVANREFDFLSPDPGSSFAPHAVYNIGNSQPNTVNELLEILEQLCQRKAIRIDKDMQVGDVERTFANTSRLEQAIGFKPGTSLYVGLKRFVDWYRSYTQQ